MTRQARQSAHGGLARMGLLGLGGRTPRDLRVFAGRAGGRVKCRD